MTNAISKKEYDKVKDKTNLSVVSFKDKKRIHTYSGLTYIQAIVEALEKQEEGYICLIIEDLPELETSWDFEDYKKYIGKTKGILGMKDEVEENE